MPLPPTENTRPPTRVAINGFGRMGRLVLRAAWGNPDFEVIHINEPAGDVASAAHLLEFDSVHGRWHQAPHVVDGKLAVQDHRISYSSESRLEDVDWTATGAQMVLECSGVYRSCASLQPYLNAGLRKVLVAAPVKDGALNIVYGINHQLYDAQQHHIVTAASCTTNCLAPIVQVIQQGIGIKHGVLTTIHDVTNTQVVVDTAHKDLRRARSALNSLIPTSTGSATAVTLIFPELKGKLNGLAVRVPLLNASITDVVFEVARPTSKDEVNGLLEQAANGPLQGILGYETRPLVSADFVNDTHSGIVDALSTMVIDETQVKILAWYDNEIGYVHRLSELTAYVAQRL